jgi:hypothetical protein
MRNNLRLSRDEEVARNPAVNVLANAILDGGIAPNTPPNIIRKKFPSLFPSNGEATGAMMHADVPQIHAEQSSPYA